MSDSSPAFAEFFPHRVCINLDRRPERWERMQARFAAAGLGAVERFPAVDGRGGGVPASWPFSSGAYGCLQSHLAVVREARAQEQESILIMEDDVVFAEGFHDQFQERVRSLPADWDMLFFGCLHYEPPEPVAPGLGRLRISFSTFMYAVRRTVYDAFIFLHERGRYPVDRTNIILQKRSRSYCFIPHLAWVEDSYSDAQGLPCTHWYIRDSMALGGERMKAVEKRTAAIIPYRETGNRDRSVRNLRYVAQCYGQLFSVLIVEQNERPHLKREALPPGCEYAHRPGPERQVGTERTAASQTRGAASRMRICAQAGAGAAGGLRRGFGPVRAGERLFHRQRRERGLYAHGDAGESYQVRRVRCRRIVRNLSRFG